MREGWRHSRALPGAVLAEIEVSDDASCFWGILFPTARAWGAPLLYSPSRTGGERAARPLELSVDGCSAEVMFSDEAGGGLLRALFSDGVGRGALRSPTAPWGRRGERAARPLELSADGCSAGVLFSDEAGGAVLLMALVSDGTGVGRSAPLRPLGDGIREGYVALSSSPWTAVLRGLCFLMRRVGLFF